MWQRLGRFSNASQRRAPIGVFVKMKKANTAVHIFKYSGGCIMLWVKNKNRMELSAGKILEENLVLSAFHQTLGDEFTFQQDNNLKDKAKSTMELFNKKTVNVPGWPSYSLDLHLLENLWQHLKMVD